MKKNTLVLILLGFLSISAGLFVSLGKHTAAIVEQVNPLEFSFPDLEGQPQALNQWGGKVIVLNFWATWCGPCLQEIPQFIQLQTELQNQGLQFVGIAIDDPASVAEFSLNTPINYPILISDESGMHLSMQLGNLMGAIPFTVIIDQTGKIVNRQMGELSAAELRKIITPLLAANT
jgi:thiol-disulfide isomerase/thioredoxin